MLSHYLEEEPSEPCAVIEPDNGPWCMYPCMLCIVERLLIRVIRSHCPVCEKRELRRADCHHDAAMAKPFNGGLAIQTFAVWSSWNRVGAPKSPGSRQADASEGKHKSHWNTQTGSARRTQPLLSSGSVPTPLSKSTRPSKTLHKNVRFRAVTTLRLIHW